VKTMASDFGRLCGRLGRLADARRKRSSEGCAVVHRRCIELLRELEITWRRWDELDNGRREDDHGRGNSDDRRGA